jgi:pyrroline-5-carboxylate reductase
MKILFLGYGRMGAALGEAWLRAGLADEVVAVDPGLPTDVRARVVGSIGELPAMPYDLVVAAVKPALACEIIARVPAEVWESALLLSVMAGIEVDTLANGLPAGSAIVRTMPNTPVMQGKGCTGLYANAGVTERERDIVLSLFAKVGAAFWVTRENDLHAITALSGSGPAYYHLFSEAMASAGEQLGLSSELCQQLVAHTALGAATQQCSGSNTFQALRQAVTSPNGTTHAAIETFENNYALRTLVNAAVRAAYHRSLALAKG